MPREELETQDNIKVKEVSRAEFARVQNERSGTDLVDIDQDTWTEVDSQTDILNTGG